jgi:mono/diheme cytochrome c family protein
MQGRPEVVSGADNRRPQRQQERRSEQTKQNEHVQMGRNGVRAALFCCLAVVVSSLSPVMLPAAMAAGDARHGEAVFLQYCQGCHGPDGRGGGKGFMPHVGPLARKGYIETVPDEYLAAVITEGGLAVGKSAYMPSWRTTLTEQDIADVIAFIRTFVVE